MSILKLLLNLSKWRSYGDNWNCKTGVEGTGVGCGQKFWKYKHTEIMKSYETRHDQVTQMCV